MTKNDFMKALRLKKQDLNRQLKATGEDAKRRDTLTRKIELLNIMMKEFGADVHPNSLKNLAYCLRK